MLADLIDLVVQTQRDAGRPEVAVHRRDRALVGSLRTHAREPRALLTAWLDALRRTEADLPGHALSAVYRLQIVLLVLLGLAVGWGAAAAVYSYDGSRPVNVVQVLAVFVGAQLLLLLPLGIVMLPQRLDPSGARLRRGPGGLGVVLARSTDPPPDSMAPGEDSPTADRRHALRLAPESPARSRSEVGDPLPLPGVRDRIQPRSAGRLPLSHHLLRPGLRMEHHARAESRSGSIA